ncbi:MAG TPA: hypothetical protein VFW45_15525 [Candidatus Polarisedimenticolia bacterium]|nr:hypothetical protein [Candidatus Polarisedimenticolia bacterium]
MSRLRRPCLLLLFSLVSLAFPIHSTWAQTGVIAKVHKKGLPT